MEIKFCEKNTELFFECQESDEKAKGYVPKNVVAQGTDAIALYVQENAPKVLSLAIATKIQREKIAREHVDKTKTDFPISVTHDERTLTGVILPEHYPAVQLFFPKAFADVSRLEPSGLGSTMGFGMYVRKEKHGNTTTYATVTVAKAKEMLISIYDTKVRKKESIKAQRLAKKLNLHPSKKDPDHD